MVLGEEIIQTCFFPPQFNSNLNSHRDISSLINAEDVLTDIHRSVCHHVSVLIRSIEMSIALHLWNEELLQKEEQSTCFVSFGPYE